MDIRKNLRRKRTFTIFEVLVTILIIATMTVNYVPKITNALDKPKDLAITRDLVKYVDAATVLLPHSEELSPVLLNKTLPEQLRLKQVDVELSDEAIRAVSNSNNPYKVPYRYRELHDAGEHYIGFVIMADKIKNSAYDKTYWVEVLKVNGKLKVTFSADILGLKDLNGNSNWVTGEPSVSITPWPGFIEVPEEEEGEGGSLPKKTETDFKKYRKAADLLVISNKPFDPENLNEGLEHRLQLQQTYPIKSNGEGGFGRPYIIEFLSEDLFAVIAYNSEINGELQEDLLVILRTKGVIKEYKGKNEDFDPGSFFPADKGPLEMIIAKAESLAPEEYEDFSLVQERLDIAIGVMNDDNASSQEVGNSGEELRLAMEGLVKKEPDNKIPDDSEIQFLIDQGYIPIASADDLDALRDTTPRAYAVGTKWETHTVGGLGKKYVQVQSIDLSSIGDFTPIGSDTSNFTGTYDGLGCGISNLTIDRPLQENVGLFGYTNNAKLKNMKLVNTNVTGSIYTGGLIGYSQSSTIINSKVTGEIEGKISVGGLAGRTSGGKIQNSSANVVIHGVENLGGLVGNASGTTVLDSYAIGTVIGTGDYVGGAIGTLTSGVIGNIHSKAEARGTNHVGGLIGTLEYTEVKNSYATGGVIGDKFVGGLVGSNYQRGRIVTSYAKGNVTGGSLAGGLVGYLNVSNNNYVAIEDSYAEGNVIGVERIGGLVGYHRSSNLGFTAVKKTYSTGKVSGDAKVGGLVGESNENTLIVDSYWDEESTEKTSSSGGIGLTTVEMKTQGSYSTWDFTDTWKITDGAYPKLEWQP